MVINLEEELHREIPARAIVEQIVLAVARIVGTGTFGAAQDQRVVVVALRQVRAGQIDGRRLARAAGAEAAVQPVVDVPRGSLVELPMPE